MLVVNLFNVKKFRSHVRICVSCKVMADSVVVVPMLFSFVHCFTVVTDFFFVIPRISGG